MELATEKETIRFLTMLYFLWGQQIVHLLSKDYGLTEEQQNALEEVVLNPNDWTVSIQSPLNSL